MQRVSLSAVSDVELTHIPNIRRQKPLHTDCYFDVVLQSHSSFKFLTITRWQHVALRRANVVFICKRDCTGRVTMNNAIAMKCIYVAIATWCAIRGVVHATPRYDSSATRGVPDD
eukprot:6209152-Pleurochrysis_carterae.AAC.1